MPERVQKVLAHAGLGARRKIEAWIKDGKVLHNGEVLQLGAKVEPPCLLEVNGRAIHIPATHVQTQVLLYHKPCGEICTHDDPAGRATIFQHLPPTPNGRWLSVGRLDVNTSGLILLTNDGNLAAHLMHPRYGWTREYLVRVYGAIKPEQYHQLVKGVELEDGMACFKSLELISERGMNRWFRVTLAEGRNREVRRMWAHIGAQVNRLMRIRYGPLCLPRNLGPGQWRAVDQAIVHRLQKGPELAVPNK